VSGTGQGSLRADGDRCGVRFERLYDATADELWRALTDPAQLRGWLAEAPVFEAEPRGRVAFELDEGDGVAGEVRAVEPGRLLEYTWTFAGESESVVRFELHQQERGTLLVLDHRRLGRRHGAGYAAGWHAYLDRLAALLAGASVDWLSRFEELRPPYLEQAEELGWTPATASPVRDALYRGDREAAEAAAEERDLDVFDAAALGRPARLAELLDEEPGLAGALSDDGFTALHLACFAGGAEAVRLLVERGAPLERLAESPIARVRPLGTAVFAGDLESAGALLEAGADPNGAGEGGFGPLHAAAQSGDEGLVRLLLAHGADPARKTDEGRSPVELARTAGNEVCARLLEDAAAGRA
jgi:uncharacterized protein